MIDLRTPGEIDAMAAAGAVVADVLATTRAAAAAGVTPLELDAIAVDVIAGHRAQSCYIGYHPSWAPSAYPTVTCISVNDAVVHTIPNARPFEPGDLVSIDIACLLDGWAADAAVSLVIAGSEDTTLADALIATAEAALVAGIDEMRVGRKLGDVSAAIGGVVRPRGFGVLADHGGHGIGREMHLPPDVPNEGRRHRGMPLRSGVVLALEPLVVAGRDGYAHHADGWGIRTADGAPAAHVEHTVAVTPDGPRVLTLPA